MGNYWANRRRREAQVGKPVIVSSETRVEFKVDDSYYSYVYRSSPGAGFAYIYKGSQMIYGPYDNNCTDEGRKIYELYRQHHLK
jgi:hypothetical protein